MKTKYLIGIATLLSSLIVSAQSAQFLEPKKTGYGKDYPNGYHDVCEYAFIYSRINNLGTKSYEAKISHAESDGHYVHMNP